jgi:hypothetical protein
MPSTQPDSFLRFIVAGLNIGCSHSLLRDSPDAAPIRWIVSTPSRSVGSHFAPSRHRSSLLPQRPHPFHCSVSTIKIKSPNVGGCVCYSLEDRHGLDRLDILRLEDVSGFRNFIRMTPTDFECRVKVFSQFKSIFRRPQGENSERTDALAVAMSPKTSTLEMLRNIVSMKPIRHGTQGTRIWAESEQLRLFVAMLRGCSDQPRFSPDPAPQQWVPVCTRLKKVAALHLNKCTTSTTDCGICLNYEPD